MSQTAEFKTGVKVRSANSNRVAYHTQPECYNYPESPIKATENELRTRDLKHCMHCQRLEE